MTINICCVMFSLPTTSPNLLLVMALSLLLWLAIGFTAFKLLLQFQVEFVLQKRSIHGDRLGTEELSIGFQQVSYFMLTLASGNQSPVNIWQFLAPFTFDSWAVLWGSLVFVSAVLALVNHFNPFEWRKQALDETNEDVPVENFNKLGIITCNYMPIHAQ